MNKNIFREYDIRGIYPIDLNEDIYYEIGNAIAYKCNQLSIDSIVLGRDGRLSGKSLMNALENSLINNGINGDDISSKIKKTYKNRYYIISRNGGLS